MNLKAVFTQIGIQLRFDFTSFRGIGTYHIVPLLYYVIVGISARNNLVSGTSAFSISIITITICAYSTLPMVLQQVRESWILETYKISGISTWSSPIVLNIALLIHDLINITIIFFTAHGFINTIMRFPSNIPRYFAILILAALYSGAIATFISSIGMKLGITSFVSIFIMIIAFAPLNSLPKILQTVLRFLPSNLSPEALCGNTSTFSTIIVIAMTIIFFALSAIMFKNLI